jgi:hypothetical protein
MEGLPVKARLFLLLSGGGWKPWLGAGKKI